MHTHFVNVNHTSGKVCWTDELLEEFLSCVSPLTLVEGLLEPKGDSPLLLGETLRVRIHEENAEFEEEMCRIIVAPVGPGWRCGTALVDDDACVGAARDVHLAFLAVGQHHLALHHQCRRVPRFLLGRHHDSF